MSLVPQYVERAPQPYVAIHAQSPRDEIGAVVPKVLPDLYAWLASNKVAPAGAPFIRYLVVNYNNSVVDMDVGVPVPNPVGSPGPPVIRGLLPGGRYTTVLHRGAYETLVDTTAELLDWAKAHDVKWQVEERDHVTTWGSRVEHYLVGPPAEKDARQWQTEIAILLVG